MNNSDPITYKTRLGTKIYMPGQTTYTIRDNPKEGEKHGQEIEIQDPARRSERDN